MDWVPDPNACHGSSFLARGAFIMESRQTIGFGMGMIIGILVGAVFDSMALGIILGCLLGFGIVKLPGGRA
jgi:hypothetical protein